MLKRIVFSVLCLWPISSWSQNIKEIREGFYRADDHCLDYAVQLRDYYFENDVDSLRPLGEFLISEGIREERKSWMYYGKFLLSYYYNNHNELAFSYANLKDCQRYYERNRDLEMESEVQNLLGHTYFRDQKYNQAILCFLSSMELFSDSPAKGGLSVAQLNLAEVFYARGRYDMAEREGRSFHKRAKQLGLLRSERRAVQLLGKVYLEQKKLERAFDQLNESMKLALEIGDHGALASAHNALAIAYTQSGDLDQARKHFLQSLKQRNLQGDIRGRCESLYNLGELCYLEGKWKQAMEYYQEEWKLSEKFSLSREGNDAMEAMAYTLEAMGKIDSAFVTSMNLVEQFQKQRAEEETNKRKLGNEFYEQRIESIAVRQRERERVLESRIAKESGKQLFFWIVIFVSVGLNLYLFIGRSIQFSRKV
ncbi:MAG: tetratricopeptide repeat protein [Bacteroidetes bacterium]|nr:MAG: tetratricopeptide repeat protein [Bacteroidota bacterium]